MLAVHTLMFKKIVRWHPIVGIVASFSAMMWLGVANQIAKSQGYVQNNQLKPTTTDNCPVLNFATYIPAFNISITSTPPISE